MTTRKKISKDLQELVSWSVDLLGQAIKIEYGKKRFQQIEKLRVSMKEVRSLSDTETYEVLTKEFKKIQKYSDQELSEIGTAFTFMMELINRCESAYRSMKLDHREYKLMDEKPHAIIMVLTAHPTEARSPEILKIFSQIQNLLIDKLNKKNPMLDQEVKHLLQLGLKVSVAREKKPSISDEAENIYSYILNPDILDELINFSKHDLNVMFRAWVGGDKDGHPGVDEKAMLQSLNLSRNYLIQYISKKLEKVESSIELIKSSTQSLKFLLKEIKKQVGQLKKITNEDGYRVVHLKDQLEQLSLEYEKIIHAPSPRLGEIQKLLWIFPAIVVPLEVREDSEVVAGALTAKETYAIERMLITLKNISVGLESKWYVRGFVLSMVQSEQDVINGYDLLYKVFQSYAIPVVPLFENENALTHGPQILEKYFKVKKDVLTTHKTRWGSRYEIMVGYSDSSKENGVLPSRLLVSNSLGEIEDVLSKKKLTPVFFHGSGGSIERGGGSIKEQTSWWPKSALSIFKATIQGEMVARNFGDKNIFRSQIFKIIEQLPLHDKEKKINKSDRALLNDFSENVKTEYRKMISSEDFLELVREATPYSHLSHLKIGSRPSKRAGNGKATSLRAIPWILCWTQTRILFPVWWGVGTAFLSLKNTETQKLKKLYGHDPLFTSYINALGFTLAKVEMSVFKMYVESSSLSNASKRHFIEVFENEFAAAQKFYRKMTGKKDLLWFRPWLQQSIDYRSSMIHPINLIQIESVKRKNFNMFVDTVTGVSCGMLTTG